MTAGHGRFHDGSRPWPARARWGPARLSDTDDRIIEEFLADSHEGLDRLDRDLIELEKDPHSQRILADAFRTLHTIKGTCSFLGYTKLEHVAHAGESLMSRLRSGQQVADRDTISALLGIVDAVRAISEHRKLEPVGQEATMRGSSERATNGRREERRPREPRSRVPKY